MACKNIGLGVLHLLVIPVRGGRQQAKECPFLIAHILPEECHLAEELTILLAQFPQVGPVLFDALTEVE